MALNKKIVWGGLVAVALVLTVWAVWGGGAVRQSACTMEAKECPDGSYVGRVPPSCEFTACAPLATSSGPMSTYVDVKGGFRFSYPTNLSTRYVHNVEVGWPPAVTFFDVSLSCTPMLLGANGNLGATSTRAIGKRTYCVNELSEGAAGSIYKNFAYTTLKGGRTVVVSFALRYPQCMNYDDPQQRACLKEQKAFDVDAFADRIVTSIQ